MCTLSMVMEHYEDIWTHRILAAESERAAQFPTPVYVPPVTQQEIEEFRQLLDRAREYDRRNNEPDCELAEKKETLRQLAKQLGVTITID